MKKYLLTLCCIAFSLFAGEPLEELFDLFEIDRANHVEDTQKKWLRKGELWELEDQHPDKWNQVFPLFRELGMIDEITPSKSHYNYALVQGARLSAVTRRFETLIQHVEEGLQIDKIVFLGGERPLDPEIETPYLPGLSTEYEMIIYVYDMLVPESMRGIEVEFVNAKMDGDDRPTATSTISEWLRDHPRPGSCLVITHQPYVNHQDAVMSRYLPKDFTFETIERASRVTNLSIYLDSITRILYLQ